MRQGLKRWRGATRGQVKALSSARGEPAGTAHAERGRQRAQQLRERCGAVQCECKPPSDGARWD